MAEPFLTDFLTRQFAGERRYDGRCVRLQLFHLGAKSTGVRTWSFPELPDTEQIDRVESEILDAAQEYASELFGRQRFSVCAYFEKRPDQVGESRPFSRHGGGAADEDENEVDSEPPSQRGLLAQLMRHNEANARAVVQNSQNLLHAQARVLASMSERLTQMENDRLRTTQLYESLLSERHLREIATKESELRIKAWGAGLEKMQLLAPVVINKLAGARILPESTTATEEALGSFFESITPEQIESLGKVLKPEQYMVVLALYEDRRKAMEKRQVEHDAKVKELTAGANGTTEGTTPL